MMTHGDQTICWLALIDPIELQMWKYDWTEFSQPLKSGSRKNSCERVMPLFALWNYVVFFFKDFREVSFIGSIIFWQCSEDFGPVISILECFNPSIGGHTFECNSKHLSSRKNQLTFEAFKLNPKWYIFQRDSFLSRPDIERPQRNLYAASAILNYNVVQVW